MFESILIGCGFAFAAAVQPGPLQAFLLSSVSQNGWKRTLPASFSPLLSDGPIALFVLLLLNQISTAMYGILQVTGGFLLLYFAWTSYRQWKRYSVIVPDNHGLMPRTLIQASMVNILNPNPYLGWSLVLGPAFLAAWQKNPIHAFTLIIAFYATIVLVLAGIIFLFGTTRFLSPAGRRILILISAMLLAAMGAYQLSVFIYRMVAT
jgi:threonine/homoserine/homoserine lactone efflux protein